MATEGSARVLGMGDFIGRIAKGYKADLVLLDLGCVTFRGVTAAASLKSSFQHVLGQDHAYPLPMPPTRTNT
jgi:cytosine/adenosine deaminase-related metal-dependent hydrolase